MKHIVKIDDKYAIFKTYESGDIKYSRIIETVDDLRTAMKLIEDEVPVNNVGSGNIAGMDLGMVKKKIKPGKLYRRKKPC